MSYKFQVFCVILLIFVLNNSRSEKIDEFLYSENQNPDELSLKILSDRYTILMQEVRRLRIKENCTCSSLNITEAIRKRDFNNVVQLIETNPRGLAATDWIPILQDIFNSEVRPELLLSELGKTMKFGTNKLMFYIAFKRFLDSKSNSLIIASGTRSDPEHKDFLNFEEEIMFLLERLFEESIIRNVDSEATKILQEIRWDKLAEQEASYLEHSKFTVIQRLFSATFEKIYFHLDVDKLIDQIQNISADLENSKDYQVHLYGALRHAISVKNDNDNRHLFKLAYAIRNHINNVHHEAATHYFDNYLRSLTESFHGCIRNIVNLTNCSIIRISNVKYDEVLYDYHSIIAEIDLNQEVDDLIFTRDEKGDKFYDDFLLEFKDKRFWIKRCTSSYKKCIDISHNTYVHASNCTNYSLSSAIKISGSDQDNENCYIQGWNSESYMYANLDNLLNFGARIVYSNGIYAKRDASYLWNFRPYNETSFGNNE